MAIAIASGPTRYPIGYRWFQLILIFTLKIREDEPPLKKLRLEEDMGTWVFFFSGPDFFPGEKKTMKVEDINPALLQP